MAVVDKEARGRTRDGSPIKGQIDYREDAPKKCPLCGGVLDYDHRIGHWYVSGPADLERAAQHGITEEGWYRSLAYDWQCRRHPDEHWGPIAIG